ncbi:MAG: hypothetical protein ACI3VN_11330 [Candidatus Onthomonas sp.]
MTDQELRRMSRAELLQMLITQMEENKVLQDRLELAETQLRDRQIAVKKAGTLAEAALSLNGVFQAADAAAKEYLENIQQLNSQQETLCRELQANAEKEAAAIVQEAQAYSQKVHSDADDYWQQLTDKARTLLEDYDTLREFALSARRSESK